MYELSNSHSTPLAQATYDLESGKLNINFDFDLIIDDVKFSKARDIDAVIFDGQVYAIEVHDISGPRKDDGNFIYDRHTVTTEFSIDTGKVVNPKDEKLKLIFVDDPDGTGIIFTADLVPVDSGREKEMDFSQSSKKSDLFWSHTPLESPKNPIETLNFLPGVPAVNFGKVEVQVDRAALSYSIEDGYSNLEDLNEPLWYSPIDDSLPTSSGENMVKVASKSKADSDVLFAINTGSEEKYVAKDGTVFQADTTGVGNKYWDGLPISGTLDDTLYQSHAWSPNGLSYGFKVENGTYLIEFFHAEIYEPNGALGLRTFDVQIEKKTVQSNVDVFAASGLNTAYATMHKVYVTDGVLNIKLKNNVENAMLSGLKVTKIEELSLDFSLLDFLL